MRRRQQGPEVYRITGARRGLAEDVRGRERRYVISMLVRTAAVLLTVLLWNVQRPLAVATLVLGVTLPYIAVVIANAGRERSPAIPSSFVAVPTRPALDAAHDRGDHDAGDGAAKPPGPNETPHSGG